MVVVMLMVLAVDVLLLSASGRFLGTKGSPLRILAGAFLGALFAGLSMVPGFAFLEHILWRLCGLILTALVAFGLRPSIILLFMLLHLSLGGINGDKMTSTLLGAAGIGFACLTVGRGHDRVPVELTYQDKTVKLIALRDTGNTLRDPITGQPVLIIGADIAQTLTGLTPAALQDPVGTMGSVPGLRLIPYQTVGNTGFLLALQIPEVKIGNRQGSTLVAFSPNLFESNYQALTGGIV